MNSKLKAFYALFSLAVVCVVAVNIQDHVLRFSRLVFAFQKQPETSKTSAEFDVNTTASVRTVTLTSAVARRNLSSEQQGMRLGAIAATEAYCTAIFFMQVRAADDASENLCSTVAHYRGPNQTVYAYSYAAPAAGVDLDSVHFKRHLRPLVQRYREIEASCPNCTLRLYHNISADDEVGRYFLCNTFARGFKIDLCDVAHIPILNGTPPSSWSLASLGDPDVDVFFDRHLENNILDRERRAVEQWRQSGRAAHVMRDYPAHKTVIVPGLWAVRGDIKRTLAVARRRVLDELRQNLSSVESALETYIWPLIRGSVLQHDSFHCGMESHNGSVPFPTQRDRGRFCGWGPYKTRESKLVREWPCPELCRPSDHKDWWFC